MCITKHYGLLRHTKLSLFLAMTGRQISKRAVIARKSNDFLGIQYVKFCYKFIKFPKVFLNYADIYITKGKYKGQGYGI